MDEVVGADVVRAYGGEVKLAQLVEGQSSTDVIAKISRRRGSGDPRWSRGPFHLPRP
jgi:hypothetical protein